MLLFCYAARRRSLAATQEPDVTWLWSSSAPLGLAGPARRHRGRLSGPPPPWEALARPAQGGQHGVWAGYWGLAALTPRQPWDKFIIFTGV